MDGIDKTTIGKVTLNDVKHIYQVLYFVEYIKSGGSFLITSYNILK